MGTRGRRDEDWFTSLYATHYPDIVRYGVRRLGELEASAELAQEVFVVAWRRRGQVPDLGLPWLYGVARKLLANEWRARRSRPVPLAIPDPEPLPNESESDTVVTVADLHAALATLSDTDQEILRLVGWEQLTVAEAAVVLDCSRTAAAVRLHRARRRLSAALGSSSIGERPIVEKGLV
jgi:RNA polymerase sigma factor (sigma-70 family)